MERGAWNCASLSTGRVTCSKRLEDGRGLYAIFVPRQVAMGISSHFPAQPAVGPRLRDCPAFAALCCKGLRRRFGVRRQVSHFLGQFDLSFDNESWMLAS